MLVYAEADLSLLLQPPLEFDRDETIALMTRLYPSVEPVPIKVDSSWHVTPPEDTIFAGCFAGLSIVCTVDAAVDVPSELDQQFLDEANGKWLYHLAAHSVVDWFAYAIHAKDGTTRRSLSLAPDHGIIENIGDPLPFEANYWAGKRPVYDEYPFPFHPIDMAEDAFATLFGFDDWPGDPIELATFARPSTD